VSSDVVALSVGSCEGVSSDVVDLNVVPTEGMSSDVSFFVVPSRIHLQRELQ
jgi:hypothetical protein